MNSPAIKPLNYDWDTPVVLAVDTSHIAIGFYIYQINPDTGKKHFARFNSIPLSEHERNYSQPKRELYGLKRALTACRYWLIGCRNLKVETDATYIKGMLEHPDEGPNATINRWIEEILRYHFTLMHVPGNIHGPDGLSRRSWNEGDPEYPRDESDDIPIEEEGLKGVEYPYGNEEGPEEFENFKKIIDTRGGYIQMEAESIDDFFEDECRQAREEDANYRRTLTKIVEKKISENPDLNPYAVFSTEELLLPSEDDYHNLSEQNSYPELTPTERYTEETIELIKEWLEKSRNEELLKGMDNTERTTFFRFAKRFSLNKQGRLCKIDKGCYKLFIPIDKRMYMMKAGHDSLGH